MAKIGHIASITILMLLVNGTAFGQDFPPEFLPGRWFLEKRDDPRGIDFSRELNISKEAGGYRFAFLIAGHGRGFLNLKARCTQKVSCEFSNGTARFTLRLLANDRLEFLSLPDKELHRTLGGGHLIFLHRENPFGTGSAIPADPAMENLDVTKWEPTEPQSLIWLVGSWQVMDTQTNPDETRGFDVRIAGNGLAFTFKWLGQVKAYDALQARCVAGLLCMFSNSDARFLIRLQNRTRLFLLGCPDGLEASFGGDVRGRFYRKVSAR